MAPQALAILLGAGPVTGIGIARVLSAPSGGNMAVALLARSGDNLSNVKQKLLDANSDAVIETFQSDTSPGALERAFEAIRTHDSFKGLKLNTAVYSIKNSHKVPFLEESHAAFTETLEVFVGGAMIFAQLAIKRFLYDHGPDPLASGASKKGTLIFTGTLGAMRCNAQFAAYGTSRSSVRMLAQSLAREFSPQGIQVVHVIANGHIVDNDGQDVQLGVAMSADAVGWEYLRLSQQHPQLWTHELDFRPAQEKF